MGKASGGKGGAGRRRGPTPEVLVIDGDWKDAVGRALKRGKPTAKKAAKKKRGQSKR